MIFSTLGILKSFSQVSEVKGEMQYATLYIYRPSYKTMRLNKYMVHVGDSIYKAVNGSHKSLRVYEDGNLEIWAKSEVRRSIIIPIVLGNHYYIRCNIEAGILKGKPILTLIDSATGKSEYEIMTKK